MMRTTRYTVRSPLVRERVRAVLVSDLHAIYDGALLGRIEENAPDVILVSGDVVHREGETEGGLRFLREAAAKFPVFLSLGNHEFKCREGIRAALEETGARLLDNDFVRFRSLVIGGLTSGTEGEVQGRFRRTPDPETAWLDGFEAAKGFRLLLCHHPEYYARHLRTRDIHLTLAGHAHGGQWRPFGIPIFAPGQGLFPRYTSGAYDGTRLIVSRGLSNPVRIPRFFNPTELVVIDLCAPV